MKKLKLKHLAAYLPYDLQMKISNNVVWMPKKDEKPILKNASATLTTALLDDIHKEVYVTLTTFLPILRPLSNIQPYFKNLYGNLEHQDVTDYLDEDFLNSMDALSIYEIGFKKVEYLPYGTLKVLLKHHFDIFDIIDDGLAIDINALT